MRAIYHHRTQGRDVEAVHIRGLAAGLEQHGLDVSIIGPPGVDTDANSTASPVTGREPTALGRMARKVPQALFETLETGYNVVAIPRLWRNCGGEKPELIYERYALYNLAGVITGRLRGIPVVLEVNDIVRMDRTRQGKQVRMKAFAEWFERRILNGATGIVVVSSYLKEQLVQLGIPAEKIRVTPNAVEADQFDPARVDGLEVRRRHGLEGCTVIGFAGSFTKWHGVDLLVRSFARLAGEFPQLRLLLVGDGAKRADSESLAEQLGIRERVIFTGKVPHSEMAAHVAAMEIGVMPQSNAFGSPMKVFEYQAMGKPAVAPRYQPLEEAIDDGRTGLLFPPGDEEALTACLRSLVADEQTREAMGHAARQKVLSRHLWVHNAAEVLELARTARPAQPVAVSSRRATDG